MGYHDLYVPQYKLRNIVTGGAGLIGSHLIDKLIKDKEEVICIDNFITGNLKNIERHIPNPNFKLIKHDVLDELPNISAERVWHMACPASPLKYQLNPIETSKICFIGTYNMLEFALKNKSKFLFASSSEIYGNPKVHPQSENYEGSLNTTSIRACYDEGKRAAETLCFDFKRSYNLDIRIARIFNTYGPRMAANDGRVISNFIVQALKGDKITIYGDGSQTRSFCYIDDMVNGLISLMNSSYQKPINLGHPREYKIKELAKKVKEKINSKLVFANIVLPESDPQRRKPNINLANEILNWEPKTSLNQGLDKTIDFFKNNLYKF